VEIDLGDPGELGEGDWQRLLDSISVTIGISDIKDTFHRLRMPSWMRPFFCLPKVKAGDVGMSGRMVSGRTLRPGSWVYPMPMTLPMGFSWSLFFCQRTAERLVSSAPRLSAETQLVDRGRPLLIRVSDGEGAVRHYVYVDNLGVISVDSTAVKEGVQGVIGIFAENSLEVHGTAFSTDGVDALGVIMHGRRLHTRVAVQRAIRIRGAIDHTVSRGRASGRCIEILLGHSTYAGLVRREALSCFHACYRFVQASYYESTELWPSVVDELRCFAGLIIMLVSSWWGPWNKLVTASDASLDGYGMTEAMCTYDEVASVGRTRERDRFLCDDAVGARERAFRESTFEMKRPLVKQEDVDLDGSWTDTPLVSGELEVVRSALPPGRVTVDSQFEEVPDSLLNPQRWKTSRFGTWMWPADISELEARALTMCLQRLCGFENFRNMRQVMIVDNMGVCLAFDRHRARSFSAVNPGASF